MKTTVRATMFAVACVGSQFASGQVESVDLGYLDEFASPYHVGLGFPKLTTPQWIGEEDVEAVVVLAIDDMRDTTRYEQYLRPILNRLKQIDGRAALSIMAVRVDPEDPQLKQWLDEGLSIEVHTYDHPCPCLQGGDFAKARLTYERCVDLLAEIPNSYPVAFRMPCCDSRNTPSPRFWSEIFNSTTAKGNFLTIDTSVFQIFTADDPALPVELVTRSDGKSRFRHYIPFPSFVNTIENYPYPYIIGGLCWQFPCIVPSDWSAQHVQQPNNPETLRDWKRALDATVIKKGTFNLVFHPHGWIRNDQVVEFINYAHTTYGKRVKFLTFNEANQRINKHLLDGKRLRDRSGQDHGIRLIDVNGDGFMDVVHTDGTRVWNDSAGEWRVVPTGFPTTVIDGRERVTAARFGRDPQGNVLAVWKPLGNGRLRQSVFRRGGWLDVTRQSGLAKVVGTVHENGLDRGLRLRDLDGDGTSELLASVEGGVEVYRQGSSGWVPAGFSLPEGVRIVGEDGRDAGLRLVDIDGDGMLDSLFSDLGGYRLDLLRRDAKGDLVGWNVNASHGERPAGQGIPVVSRNGENNGVWFHSQHLWLQNEQTDKLPDGVDRRSYRELLGELADIPPPRSPDKALRSFELSIPGRIELVAAEPLIADPIAFDWGPDGRLWVAEMADYPLGVDGNGKVGGRVRVLSDRDGDGQYDTSVVFLDDLPYPTGIKVWRRGVLVSTAPDVFYAVDLDGDDRADHRETLFSGFREGNQQHRVNGLRWGLDNWLYLANGDSGGEIVSSKTGKSINISGRDLRIRPDGGAMDTVAGQTQFGRNRDDWGSWFGGNNSNPGWHYVLDAEMIRRNPHAPPQSMRQNVTSPPGAAPVFPRSRTLTRFNDFSRADRFTSACSHEIYRDQAWPDMRGDLLICEPVHNLVHRHKLTSDGATFSGSRHPSETDRELLTSTDNWFRPVMVRTGPDGGVWVADMYRLVIEHPEWIPKSWQQRLNLRDGENAGRIYRIVPPEKEGGVSHTSAPNLADMSLSKLIGALEHPNGWVRDMAQQMILWRQGEQSSVVEIRDLLQDSSVAWGRVHAISVLHGLGRLQPKDLLVGIRDSDPHVRAHSLRMGREVTDGPFAEAVYDLAGSESDPRVQLQIAYWLGQPKEIRAARQLAVLANRIGNDRWLLAAVASSIRPDTLSAFSDELHGRMGVNAPLVLRSTILRMSIASRGWGTISKWLPTSPGSDDERRFLLQNLARVLQATRGKDLDEDRLAVGLQVARRIAADPKSSGDLRRDALEVLGFFASDHTGDAALAQSLLSPGEPPSIQIAGVRLLLRVSRKDGTDVVLSRWRSLTPRVRDAFVEELLRDDQTTTILVDRIEDGTVRRSELGTRIQQLLRESRDEGTRRRIAKLWTGESTRKVVIEKYAAATEIPGNIDRGKELFSKHCAACHRLQGVGHDVAPNLAALTDRSAKALLIAIMDPNQAVEDKYVDYIVVTNDGRTFRGMMGLETDTHVVLHAGDNKQFTIPRSDIEELVSSGRSLMPDGFERQVDQQQLADLITYLQRTRSAPKSFEGNKPKIPILRDDGSARLLATDCRIYGPTLVFESQYRNLGFWGSEQDTAIWTVRLQHAGKYRVVLDYACAADTAGNRFRLEANGQVLTGKIQGTGTWDNYRTSTIGVFDLPAGEFEVTLRSDGPLQSYLMDLHGVILRPQ